MVALLFLVLANVMPLALSSRKGCVSSLYSELQIGQEHERNCYIRGTWLGQVPPYKMICFQCHDYDRSVVIYHGKRVVDQAYVDSCNHLRLAVSVTILPKENHKHKIEYNMNDGRCKRVIYYENGKTRRNCYIPQWKDKFSLGFLNGWHKKSVSWRMGVVKTFITKEQTTCSRTIAWKSEVSGITMKCYRCTSGLIVIIYNMDRQMAAAFVGSCRSNVLEDSIDILQRSKRTPSDTTVQYKLSTEKCLMKTYQKQSTGFKETLHRNCQFSRIYHENAFTGYRNGWKKTMTSYEAVIRLTVNIDVTIGQ